MTLYSIIANEWEVDPTAPFLGFSNSRSNHYFLMQREEGSEGIILPNAGNVWIELNDQGWGGHGGIVSISMDPGGLFVRLTEDMARALGGHETLRVAFSFPSPTLTTFASNCCWSWPDTMPSWRSAASVSNEKVAAVAN